MAAVLYEFKTLARSGWGDYIYQLVRDRMLTSIYHSHDFYEWICVLRGTALQAVNESRVPCTQGDIFLLRPGDRHCFLEQAPDVEILSLSVKKEEFSLFANAYDPHLCRQCDAAPAVIQFRLYEPLPQRPVQDMTVCDCKLLLSHLLHAYLLTCPPLRPEPDMPHALRLALEEMKKEEHLREGIPALMALTHYSRPHLARLVRAHCAMSLKEYINDLRLQYAYQAIILTRRPAEEVAWAVGFQSYSHFSRIFKARFSLSPAALRKEHSVWTV